MNDCKETPVQFGPQGALIGIVTAPSEGPLAPVACILLNMGANHRVGPRRINVKLARQMATAGIASMRLDLAGLGDSGPASGAEHFRTQAVLDLQAAMNLVETTLGVRRFIVIGLCSGASNGLALAVADSRVVGLLLFDGYSFVGRRSRWELMARRGVAALSNPAVIGKTARWLQRKFSSKAAAARLPHIFEPDPPEVTAALFRRSMMQLAERNVGVFFLYSGTMHVTDRDRDQLGLFAGEPFTKQFDYEFIGEIDHSLTSLASQSVFMRVACDWALRVVQGASVPSMHPSSAGRAVAHAAKPHTGSALRSDPVT
ncbi:MAG: hypothetical protein EOP82_05240 [Variovorax sp.]|nr:MAG: hypothetical protein EOP82_05240 [Variovorax sp.]